MNRLNPAGRDVSKFINKAWLALGDAALAMAGRYALSYQAKRKIAAEVIAAPQLRLNYQRAIDIRLRPDLHAPWQPEDMAVVLDAWEDGMQQLSRAGAARLSLPAMAANLVRHLRDERLPVLDALALRHPRERISAALPALLRTGEPELLVDGGNALLDLWGSYS